MRLRIKEYLRQYNDLNDTSLNMADLALIIFDHRKADDGTKIMRMSGFNTGNIDPPLSEIIKTAEFLGCSIIQLIDAELI